MQSVVGLLLHQNKRKASYDSERVESIKLLFRPVNSFKRLGGITDEMKRGHHWFQLLRFTWRSNSERARPILWLTEVLDVEQGRHYGRKCILTSLWNIEPWNLMSPIKILNMSNFIATDAKPELKWKANVAVHRSCFTTYWRHSLFLRTNLCHKILFYDATFWTVTSTYLHDIFWQNCVMTVINESEDTTIERIDDQPQLGIFKENQILHNHESGMQVSINSPKQIAYTEPQLCAVPFDGK